MKVLGAQVKSKLVVDHLETLEQMYEMAVYSAGGTQYLPIRGYDGEWCAYFPARDALRIWQIELERIYDQAQKLNDG